MQLADYIRQARRILIFTGAGISTGSGIPDFRGPQGIWTRRQPVYYQDFLSSEAARLEYWDQKLESWETFRTARPNAVHHAARMLESSDKLLMVVTQNVDGLHAQAGISAERLLEVHGTNAEVECQSCGRRAPADPVVRRFEAERVPPRCECGGLLKAATISFGQALDPRVLASAQDAAEQCDLVIIGFDAGGAAGVPDPVARGSARHAIHSRQSRGHRSRRTSRCQPAPRGRCRPDLPLGRAERVRPGSPLSVFFRLQPRCSAFAQHNPGVNSYRACNSDGPQRALCPDVGVCTNIIPEAAPSPRRIRPRRLLGTLPTAGRQRCGGSSEDGAF